MTMRIGCCSRPTSIVDDDGGVAVEVALSVPFGVMLVFLVVAAFNLGRTTIDVNSAAAAGARAASLSRTAAGATVAAQDAANANLSSRCASVSVTVDTTDFRRGGSVTVAVTCQVVTQGLTGLSLPGSVTTEARSTSPIDVYRSVTP